MIDQAGPLDRWAIMRAAQAKSYKPAPFIRPAWLEDYPKDRDGLIRANAHTLARALHECEELAGCFAYATDESRIIMRRRAPLDDYFSCEEFRYFTHDDLTGIAEYLAKLGFASMRRRELFWAIHRIARDCPIIFNQYSERAEP